LLIRKNLELFEHQVDKNFLPAEIGREARLTFVRKIAPHTRYVFMPRHILRWFDHQLFAQPALRQPTQTTFFPFRLATSPEPQQSLRCSEACSTERYSQSRAPSLVLQGGMFSLWELALAGFLQMSLLDALKICAKDSGGLSVDSAVVSLCLFEQAVLQCRVETQ
jgi:hypothetical protein